MAAGLNLGAWQVKILGTDIGVGALEAARNPTFNERAMRLVPEDLRQRFFKQLDGVRCWQPKPALTAQVQFRQHNLLAALREKPFDLVFVKNVLIYFDGPSKRTAMDHVRAAVAPGGLIVCGAAEGVTDLLKDYDRPLPWLFRKPKGN